ncbi:glycine betaine ABC transporter substrate-binding protein [Parapusillimonas granuli]|nr:glycine betaine ABC transporter substrate-binding protein [Parapusillimonas granuli]MBB5213361.1 osmoprotectant transport system substrate-binding protein [Parapusillimonas granuli]
MAFPTTDIRRGMALLLMGLAGTLGSASAAADTVRVGSKNFTEQYVLAEIYAQAFEAEGIKVARKLNLGGTLIAHKALLENQIDFYPEYTGTMLLAVLKEKVMTDPGAVYERVKQAYAKQGIAVLDQAPVNNTYVLVMMPGLSKKNGVATLSDLATHAQKWTLGAGPEFRDREDGIPGLKQKYGMNFKSDQQLAIGLRYRALKDNQVQVVNGYATDGMISAMGLVRLKDDKQLWPPYFVAPVVRREVIDQNPKVATVANKVSAMLSDEVMSRLNYLVDGEKQEPADVARDFLKSKGMAK